MTRKKAFDMFTSVQLSDLESSKFGLIEPEPSVIDSGKSDLTIEFHF